MNIDPRPCPFCGSDAVLQRTSTWDWFVRCTNKECGARSRNFHENQAGAVTSWNRRTKWYATVDRQCCRCRHWKMTSDESKWYCDIVSQIREAEDYCSKFEEI